MSSSDVPDLIASETAPRADTEAPLVLLSRH